MPANMRPYNPYPVGWSPYASSRPASVAARTDMQVHPVANPTAPGYAYGTLVPLTGPKLGLSFTRSPYTRPVARTFSLQVPMKPQLQGVTPVYAKGIAVTGAVNGLPGAAPDIDAINAMQVKLAQVRR